MYAPARAAAVVGVALALAACGRTPERRLSEYAGATMGTSYSVKVVDLPPAEHHLVGVQVQAVVDDVNGMMSTYRDDSELSRFNRNPSTDWIPASPALCTVVAEAQRVSALSDGAFDVTVGPLVNLWGFGPDPEPAELPTEADIAAARARTGYRQLQVRASPPALRKARADLYVDLSAIAKGYAVDRVAAALESRGLHRYLVEIGGELRAAGLNHHDAPWAIAIEEPVPSGERRVHEVVRLDDTGIATSGDYRNYYERQGHRYSHTIDPRTGYPVQHALASVSVLAPTTMAADALATTFMVLGPDAGFELARRERIAALFLVRTEAQVEDRATPGFAPRLSRGGAR